MTTGMMNKCFSSESWVSQCSNKLLAIIDSTCDSVVIAPPEPATCSEQDQTRNEGETIVLRPCKLASPVQLSELHLQWSKDGVPIQIWPGGRFTVNHDGLLIISSIQPFDSGLYQINISNSQGSALHTVRLEVIPLSSYTSTSTGTLSK